MKNSLTVRKLAQNLKLDILVEEKIDSEIILTDIHRAGVELAGYFIGDEKNIEKKIQILEKSELKFLYSLDKEIREYNLIHYFNYDFPCVILNSKEYIDESFYLIAKISNKTILYTDLNFVLFNKKLRQFLYNNLNIEINLNKFIFLDVSGLGILLYGHKNLKGNIISTVLNLLNRGHRLISEEFLTVRKIGKKILGINDNIDEHGCNFFLKLNSGKNFNIIENFGLDAIRREKFVDMIIKFEQWDSKKEYDRLGLNYKYKKILGVKIPEIVIPVEKGRNLSIIVEAAAINERARQSGINSSKIFEENIKNLIKQNSKNKTEKLKSITFKDLTKKFDFEVLNKKNKKIDREINQIKIFNAKLHHPELEFIGHFEILKNKKKKIQVIDESTIEFISKLDKKNINKNLKKYLEFDFPFIIISTDNYIPKFFLNKIIKNNKIVVKTDSHSRMLENLEIYLNEFFATYTVIHGIFVEIHGFGVLVTGKSGIGKSEAALELISRGHRLIADDYVKLVKHKDGCIFGTADKIPYFMEIRGLGILDIKTLYGFGAIKDKKKLEIVLNLEKSNKLKNNYQNKNQTIQILNEEIKKIDIFISSQKNVASMIEQATLNVIEEKTKEQNFEMELNNEL